MTATCNSDVTHTSTPEATPAVPLRRGGLKLTPRQANALRAKRARGVPVKALMEEYGVSKATVFRYLAEGENADQFVRTLLSTSTCLLGDTEVSAPLTA